MEKESPQTRKGILKLRGNPVKDKLYLEYVLNPEAVDGEGKPVEGKDRFIPIKDSSVEVWIHPLTADEMEDVNAIVSEGFRRFSNMGAEENDAYVRGANAGAHQHLYFCLRKSEDKKSIRVFQDVVETIGINPTEVERLIGVYNDSFVPSREEIKNSLRERLGLPSEIVFTSPNDSNQQA